MLLASDHVVGLEPLAHKNFEALAFTSSTTNCHVYKLYLPFIDVTTL